MAPVKYPVIEMMALSLSNCPQRGTQAVVYCLSSQVTLAMTPVSLPRGFPFWAMVFLTGLDLVLPCNLRILFK